MNVRLKVIVAVVFLLVLQGVFLRFTVFSSSDGELAPYPIHVSDETDQRPLVVNPTEDLKIKQMTLLQEQQQEIHTLQRQLHEKQTELLQQQQKQQQMQEDQRQKEQHLRELQAKLDREKENIHVVATMSDSEWEESRDKVLNWAPNVVTEWARRVCGLDAEELSRILKMKLNGVDLLKQTKSDFVMAGFPLGPATKLSESVHQLLIQLGLANTSEVVKKKKRSPVIAVIGAGYSGIGIPLSSLPSSLTFHPPFFSYPSFSSASNFWSDHARNRRKWRNSDPDRRIP
jgi:hypothetical protein